MKSMIKLVKPYDGSGDICKWLDKFKNLMKLQKVEGETSEYIPYFLEGDARDENGLGGNCRKWTVKGAPMGQMKIFTL